MGPLKQILGMIPGMGGMLDSNPDVDPEGEINRIDAMIGSMTPDERRNPDKIDLTRRNRIANGSGTQPSDVHELITQFQGMAPMMSQMANMGLKDRLKAVRRVGRRRDDGSQRPIRQGKVAEQTGPRGFGQSPREEETAAQG